MTDLIQRLRTIAKAAVTWLTVAGVVISIVWTEVGSTELLPDGVEEDIGRWVGVVLVVLATAVSIIRRVSEVDPSERGVIPKLPTREEGP